MSERELLDFIQGSIRSVWNVELLLWLWRHAERDARPDELVRELRASARVVQEGLQVLQTSGLVRVEEGQRYRYAPASPHLETMVADLETLYRERPTTVAHALFAPPSKLRTFADAFRVRKD